MPSTSWTWNLIILLTLFCSWLCLSSSDFSWSQSFRDSRDLYIKNSLFESVLSAENPLEKPSSHFTVRDAESKLAVEEPEEDEEKKEMEVSQDKGSTSTEKTNHSAHEDHDLIHVASWQWEYVRTPFVYTAVVIVAGLCKIGFHHAGFLSSIIPESCMLIMLGIVVGTIVHFTHSRELLPQFTPKAFFLFLLPPIVLESAYSLHDRAFFSNLGTITLYAVVGTIFNCFAIGLSLYWLANTGALGYTRLHLIECLVFSSLISAVDPVAVLAIFQEIGVNKSLYFLVFGESLLNDAVTIVLYMMMVGFSKAEYITAEQVGMGIAAFICVSVGGLAIGLLMGILTALITKHTEDVRVVEPLAMLGVAYLSYLLAEMVHFSGIISIIGCGIVQAHYASKNISQKSNTTVKYFTKMVSAVCDTVIFLFLGMVLVDDQHKWQTGFVLWSTGLCFVYRFIGVFFLTYCANKLERTQKINIEEQFIMAYGGLRGAVAFSLVVMLDNIDHKQLFITTTLFIILFTVFVQGATIKPLVVCLKIRLQAAKTTSSLFTEVNKKLLDHVMAGVEEVTGDHGGNYWQQILFYYNNKYLKKWLQCNYKESNLTRVYTRMMLEDHFAHLYGPAAAIEDHKLLLLRRVSTEEPEDDLAILSPLEEEEEEEEEEVAKEEKEVVEKPEKVEKKYHVEFLNKESDQNEEDQETKPLRPKRQERPKSPSLTSEFKRPPLLKRQTTLSLFRKPEEGEDPSRILQKALQDNPYNKLHQKYNPNLIGDEDQDVGAHLRARRLRARRLTLLALHNSQQDSNASEERRLSENGEVLTSIPTPTAPQPLPSLRAVTIATNYFLERAHKRRALRKESGFQRDSAPNDTPASSTNKPLRLERQEAMIAEIKEEPEETEVEVSIVETPKDNSSGDRRPSLLSFFKSDKKAVETKV